MNINDKIDKGLILFFSSLYTSLNETVINEEWKPLGMPTYYKLIEELSQKGFSLIIVYHCREPLVKFKVIRRIYLKEIDAMIYVLPWYKMNIFHKRIESILNGLYHFVCATFYVIKYCPDLIYTDKSHTREAAFFVLLGKRVFLRMYGVTKVLFDFMEKNRRKLLKNITYYSFFAKYSYVLGTLDGSDVNAFFEKYLNSRTPKKILLNGVDIIPAKSNKGFSLRKHYDIPDYKKIIVFLSRFSPEKGGEEFIKVIDGLRKLTGNFIAIMIGYGPLKDLYLEMISQRKLSGFIEIVGKVEHDKVLYFLSQSDLYISFNKEGNICNTVLESLGVGTPVLTYRDRHTYELFGDAVVYVEKNEEIASISNKVFELITNNTNMQDYKRLVSNFAENNLKSWQERISEEVNIIENIINP